MDKFKEIEYKTNIEDIKSSFVLKQVFSFLSKKQILRLAIYNNKLQNIFSIDINDYKKTSCKYKIGKKNGKGREYRMKTNILIFEGEYLNGKKNGKGKEYYQNNKLMFEGEYLNGKRWNGKGFKNNGIIEYEIKNGNGIIKEYYENNELKFEGEYLNGNKNGKGKEYYKNGNIKFEGEYLNEEKNGKGKEYYNNGELKFEGEYIYDKRNGM